MGLPAIQLDSQTNLLKRVETYRAVCFLQPHIQVQKQSISLYPRPIGFYPPIRLFQPESNIKKKTPGKEIAESASTHPKNNMPVSTINQSTASLAGAKEAEAG